MDFLFIFFRRPPVFSHRGLVIPHRYLASNFTLDFNFGGCCKVSSLSVAKQARQFSQAMQIFQYRAVFAALPLACETVTPCNVCLVAMVCAGIRCNNKINCFKILLFASEISFLMSEVDETLECQAFFPTFP